MDGNCGAARLPGLGAGVMIETAEGPVPVDWLRPGDRVLTRDSGFAPVLWAGRAPGAAPAILLREGALGPGLPARDLPLCAGHRLLLRGPELELHFACREALAEAGDLEARAEAPEAPHYLFLLPRHEAVLAEGLWLESLQPGPAVLAALGPRAAGEIAAALPGAEAMQAARFCLTGAETRLVRDRVSVPPALRRVA